MRWLRDSISNEKHVPIFKANASLSKNDDGTSRFRILLVELPHYALWIIRP